MDTFSFKKKVSLMFNLHLCNKQVMRDINFTAILQKNSSQFHCVVPFNKDEDALLKIDFTENNTSLTTDVYSNQTLFSKYIQQQLAEVKCKYGIGGYNELRAIYSRSAAFNGDEINEEPRRLHLGIDIWGEAGTPVFAPFGGMVHSFAFNNNDGDYGATIILLHQLNGYDFYTLYGHVSLADIQSLLEGQYINRGEKFAHLGKPAENGNWPPHLHFQIIQNIEYKKGDYPGVCRYSEREKYLHNCPDPDLILNMMQYAK